MTWFQWGLVAVGVWVVWLVFKTPTWKKRTMYEQWSREGWAKMLRDDEERRAQLEREAEEELDRKKREAN